ncbi:cytochrome ubiquinol oxidase subunit II [Devosia yakushimensis]|uniref:Ubiquinol oxidase polypeptide II n=1 Tax=Devosia yakushimensis TaxID=470028 RepID=A0ABQ5UGN8_9HYPH|nr:cytochrome ubiquinol oxidase subunit II [Devosia yakushimensis]
MSRNVSRLIKLFLAIPLAALLAGCNAVVLAPAGDIAAQQRDLILIATVLMLLIIIPVLALVIIFARKYRQGNTGADYQPDWDHSTHLELVIWAAPLAIIICLGAVTWVGTHLLDPYRQLARIAPDRPVSADMTPLEVEVVALDWKWLFIYPQYNIASLNELVAPVDRPISFTLTSSSVMNSFYIPALAGQIYAMPGMQTRLHAVVNHPGSYKGFSANYSGHGFSGMHFEFRGVDDAGFDQWIADVRGADAQLDRKVYLELEKPTERVPVAHFAGVENGLYTAIVNMCVELDKMCMSEMMSIDARGGLGLAGVDNIAPALYGGGERNRSALGPQKTYVAALCSVDEAIAMTAKLPALSAPRPGLVTGAGLTPPSALQAPAAAAMSWLAGQTASLENSSAATAL